MSMQIANSQENQSRRLALKTMNQQMSHLAVHGAGLSPWEAKELVRMIDEVYFPTAKRNLKKVNSSTTVSRPKKVPVRHSKTVK